MSFEMASVGLLAFVTIERIVELGLARHNTRALLARGAREAASGHYVFIVAFHAAWLAGLWILAWDRPVSLGWLAVFACLQALRVWTLMTLGRRWTTRIIVLPGAPLVASGPYRLLSHPNYAVVVGEVAALPLALGLPIFALVSSLLNALLLVVRIRAESRALAGSP
ncbi:isoprenylcysteine carboxyl methyltransferase family protein [Lichenihabitans sp. PAMC28606]|uniref:isoprenylcysteine carboxyl methyltransferase family protein n=1 Tax=Lichenihabitans sp. PAMC28606 TaxID=2880932 RepID=UPI0039B652D3